MIKLQWQQTFTLVNQRIATNIVIVSSLMTIIGWLPKYTSLATNWTTHHFALLIALWQLVLEIVSFDGPDIPLSRPFELSFKNNR